MLSLLMHAAVYASDAIDSCHAFHDAATLFTPRHTLRYCLLSFAADAFFACHFHAYFSLLLLLLMLMLLTR